MNNTYLSHYLSPYLNFYKHTPVREVSVSFSVFSALLDGLLLQHTLHASVCFASCNRSDLSVLVAGKSRSRTEILANTSTYLEKQQQQQQKQLLMNNELIMPPSLAGNIHYCCFSWNGQLTFNSSRLTCPLTTPTKSHPHKFNYCDLFFAMPSTLEKFTTVKFTQNI